MVLRCAYRNPAQTGFPNSSAPFGRAWGGGCRVIPSVRTREEEGQGLHPRTYVRLTTYNMHPLGATQNQQKK